MPITLISIESINQFEETLQRKVKEGWGPATTEGIFDCNGWVNLWGMREVMFDFCV